MSGARDTVRTIVDGVVTRAGFDLEDLSVMAAGRRRQVKVVVDRDGGVLLDDAAHLSREISQALDDHGVMGEAPYVLEVTSPGVDRPLTAPRHWRRNVGRLVLIERTGAADQAGRIEAVDEVAQTVTIRTEPEHDAWTCDLEEIVRATIQIEFSRPAGSPEDDVNSDDDATLDVDDTSNH